MVRVVNGVLSLVLALAGCASATEGTGGTSSPSWSGDGGTDSCPWREHLCAWECAPDLPNEPENGCSRGCGEPCAAPDGGTPICTADGLCDFTCAEGMSAAGSRCVCEPTTCEAAGAECGEIDDGCGGTLDCGGCSDGVACVAGSCGCAPDAAEPNDVPAMGFSLGAFSDRPQTTRTYDSWGLGAATDVDWYEAAVSDNFGDGNPTVTVTLSGLPAAGEVSVGVWYHCDSGGDASSCDRGAADDSHGHGCVATGGSGQATVVLQTSCSGTDEGGTLLVRVLGESTSQSCESYDLTVDVD